MSKSASKRPWWKRVRPVGGPAKGGPPRRCRRLVMEQFEFRNLLAQVTLTPVADNTIFESPNGDTVSNGAGVFLFAGQAGAAAGARRALLKFDIAGAIPAGSQINSVSLQLHVSKTISVTPLAFSINKILADWGEGTSDSGTVRPGVGAPATPNDATWRYRFFSQTEWSSRGGDFSGTASATAQVSGTDTLPTWSSAQMAADVQGWLNSPGTDFGWLVKQVNEATETTAKEFESRENATNRPKLVINYTPGPTNAPPTLDTIGGLTIDEDAAQQTVNLTGISAGSGESQAITITAASNNTALIPNPTVSYSSPNATGSLNFTPTANQSGSANITVTVRDAGPDGISGNTDDASLARTFNVTVNSVNDPPTLNGIGNPAAILEDAGQQTVNLSGITAGPNENQTLAVTATSDNPSLIPNPTINYISPNSTGSMTYAPAANQSGSAVITVTVRDAGLDGIPNSADDLTVSRSFTVSVDPINDAPTLNAINNPAAINEDAAQQTINLSGIAAGPLESQSITITATSSNTGLIPNPTVNYASPNSTGSLVYTPVANLSGTATITVTVKDNGGTASGGVDIFTRTFTVTVNPVNDAPTLNAISNPAAILEDAGQQTINLSGIGAGDGESQTLTVTAASSNPGLIPSPTVAYSSPNSTGSLTYTPVANQSGTATITVTIKDNGGIASGGVDTTTRTFTVAVTPVNDPPTLGPIANPPAIQENAGQQTVNLTGISAGPSESQALFVTATSNNTSLIPNPTVNYASPNSTGSLSYTPVANQHGSAVITVTVHDPGTDGTPGNGDDLTFSQQFTVLVNDASAVNQAPSFVKGPDVSATDEDGPRSIAGWATSISPGPAAEAAQTVNFIVTVDKTALFATQPQIDPTGKLTFAPAPNAHDTAIVTVKLHDNGGTANGGVDTSAPQTFNITNTKPHVWHNTLNPLDVTGDNHVVAGDALEVINYINAFTASAVPANAPFGPPYYDVSGDDFVAPGDALGIINIVNAGQGGEGESVGPSSAPAADAVFHELGQQSIAPSAIDALMLASMNDFAETPRRRL